MILQSSVGWSYRKLLKPVLFRFDPELVHDRAISAGRFLGKTGLTRSLVSSICKFKSPVLRQKILGIKFDNPVGLSAGFDKDAQLLNILDDVGFGFAQIGSVTWKPYLGNPRPRLYRLPKSKGIVVYYGLKSAGAPAVVDQIKHSRPRLPISISIAKTNSPDTRTLKGGIDDYLASVKYFSESAIGDFYTLNISCPNAFGGEPFTAPARLDPLLTEIDRLKLTKPLFIKMPIDLGWNEFRKLVKVASDHKVAGLVIGNLTKNRRLASIKDRIPTELKGGISGLPTQSLSDHLIGHTYQEFGSRFVIIGAGGIFSATDAYRKIKLGSSLIQLITGMIFEGPQVVGEINQGLVELAQQDGFSSIAEAVGSEFKKN